MSAEATWLDDDDRPGGGAFFVYAEAPTTAYPHSGTCARCLRERDDLFWHEQERTYYCVDIFRCEHRYYAQGKRQAAVAGGSADRTGER